MAINLPNFNAFLNNSHCQTLKSQIDLLIITTDSFIFLQLIIPDVENLSGHPDGAFVASDEISYCHEYVFPVACLSYLGDVSPLKPDYRKRNQKDSPSPQFQGCPEIKKKVILKTIKEIKRSSKCHEEKSVTIQEKKHEYKHMWDSIYIRS